MASKGLNKVMLIGNVGQEPESKYMPSGEAVTNLSIATSESWKDKNTGNTQERTEWHRITFYRRLAEIARDYLRKGSKIYVEGSIRSRKWTDKNGQERTTVEIIATELQMLDSKGGTGPYAEAAATAPAVQSMDTTDAMQREEAFDDDLPF
jgi:single-strand DNA-binding protein